MARTFTLALISAALLSLATRPWGSGLFAILGVAVLLHSLIGARWPWLGAVAASIAWLGIGVPSLEGTAIRLWWSFPALLAVLVLGWFLAGLTVSWLSVRYGERTALIASPLALVAAETLISQRSLLGSSAIAYFAYTQSDTPLLSLAAWSGSSGVVFAVGVLAVGVYWLGRTRWVAAAISIVAVLIVWMVPAPGSRLGDETNTLKVAAIQGAQPGLRRVIAQHDAPTLDAMMANYERLVVEATSSGAELVVLGENWLPDSALTDGLPTSITAALSSAPAAIVGGYEPANGKLYNSAFLWQGEELTSIFRKVALVPVVESHLSAGDDLSPVMVQGAYIGLAICLDSVHAGLIRESVMQGAELLVIITDDAFAGYTTTPHVHLASAALRAAETGRSVVFANEWGPSAVIGPNGKMIGSIGLGEAGVVVAQAPVLAGVTPYVALGDWLGVLSSIVLGVVVVGGLLQPTVVPVPVAADKHRRNAGDGAYLNTARDTQ